MSSSDHIHVGDTINGQYRVIDFGDEPGTIITKSMDGATVVFHLSEVTRHSSSHDWTPPAGYEKYLAPVVGQQEDEPMSNEPAQVATKVGKLSENLKHLDKPGRRETPRRTDGFCTTFAMAVQGGWWGRKVYAGRNKGFRPWDDNADLLLLDPSVGRAVASWGMDTTGVSFARLSRSALLRWFPVALENTIYSDAIVRHNVSGNGAIKRGYLVYSIANTRHYYHTTMRDKQVWYLGNKVR